MRLSPIDFLYYSYCPYIYDNRSKCKAIDITPTDLEIKTAEAIIETEKRCLLKEAFLTPRKIFRAIDNIWWPYASSIGLAPKDIESRSLIASKLASLYCKYDFAEFETVAINTELYININNSILVNKFNIIKHSNNTVVVIDFGRKDLTSLNIVGDIGAMASALILAKHSNQTVNYISVCLNESKQDISTALFILRKEDILSAEKTIKFYEYGIRNNVKFPNKWNCKECRACKNLFSLTNEDIHSK
jgi:hypothetical protein